MTQGTMLHNDNLTLNTETEHYNRTTKQDKTITINIVYIVYDMIFCV